MIYLPVYVVVSSCPPGGDRVPLEYWKLSFEPLGIGDRPRKEGGSSLHKRFAILIRNVYSVLRVLPVYELIRKNTTPVKCHVSWDSSMGSTEYITEDQNGFGCFRFGSITTYEGTFHLEVTYAFDVTHPGDARVAVASKPIPAYQKSYTGPGKCGASSAPVTIQVFLELCSLLIFLVSF
eukprot:TRINITY_DN5773_c0_g1_i3.p1 TRINITY_DN5773_c0_g1~~TRINITY_DN5773_c0_g1_i3.p1  ORF type:complete len:179 (-),score=26.47 TRINITY_DN5773_c0_g1_i3:760-1296(-)